jgi:flagellar FliJ protein
MYKFSLGPVLNHRKFLEENLQKQFASLEGILLVEKKKLADFKRAKKEFSEELQDKTQKSITISESQLYVTFIEQLTRRMNKQKEKVLNAEKDVEKKRVELIDAMKNRKALEKLKEKGFEKYKLDMMRKEQNFMNEMASVRFKSES